MRFHDRSYTTAIIDKPILVCLSDKKIKKVRLPAHKRRTLWWYAYGKGSLFVVMTSWLLSAWSVSIFHSFNRTKCLTPSLPQHVTFFGLKNAPTHLKQYIFRSDSTSTFNATRFDENPPPSYNCTGWLGVKHKRAYLLMKIHRPHITALVDRA